MIALPIISVLSVVSVVAASAPVRQILAGRRDVEHLARLQVGPAIGQRDLGALDVPLDDFVWAAAVAHFSLDDFLGGGRRGRERERGGSDEKRSDEHACLLPGGDGCQRIPCPKADAANSAARTAVAFWTSRTGFTSTRSSAMSRPESATISISRCASR